MIHQLLAITRPLFVLDTETTGLDVQTSRIIELGFQEWTAEGMIKEWRTLINPGIPIPAASSAVHHITDMHVAACQVCETGPLGHDGSDHDFKPTYTFKQLAANLAKGFTDCDYAGQNVRFDLRVISAEMQRAGVAWDYAGARIIDSGKLEQIAVPRTLSHLYAKYVRVECIECHGVGDVTLGIDRVTCRVCSGYGRVGLPHDGAHGALSDVRAAATVITKQLETHSQLPRDIDALHALQWPGWIDSGGQFQFRDGVPTVCFGKWRDKPMQSVERTYWTWLGGPKSGFSDEMRAIANAAARGEFPEKP